MNPPFPSTGAQEPELMKQSKAKPPSGDLDFSKFAPQKSSTGSAKKTVYDTSAYTATMREEDPWPDKAVEETKSAKLELSACLLGGPKAELHFDQPAPVQCDFRSVDPAGTASIDFQLQYRYLDADPWTDIPSRASASATGASGTATSQIPLSPEARMETGKPVQYRVVASSTSAARPEESPKVDLKYKILVPYLGSPEISHPKDSRLPSIGPRNEFGRAMAALLQKLSTYPAGGADMAVSFGFAAADATGGARKLADARSRAIKAILRRDVDAWKDLGKTELKLLDIQSLMSELSKNHQWNCDPGKVDGVDGPSTRAALNGFQKECNHRFKTNYTIDGKLGKQTWEGVLKVYCSMVRAARGEDPSKPADWPLPDFPSSGTQGTFSNGSDFPDPPDRSAEVCLFHPVDVPTLANPPSGGAVTTAENPVEDPEKFEKKKLDLVKDPEEPSPDRKVLRFLGIDSKVRKQYVNLSGQPECGTIVELEVEVDSGVKVVHWKAIAGKGNSKRNSPVVGWMEDGKKIATAMKGASATWTSPAADGKAKARFCVGLAGGDEFTIEVGPSAGVCDIRQKIVNWRKLWYVLTHGKGSKVPSMALSKNKARDVFIELVPETPIVHTLFPAGKVYVGNHNYKDLEALFKPVHNKKCLQIVICDQQVDGYDNATDKNPLQADFTFEMTSQNTEYEFTQDTQIAIDPPVVKGQPLIHTSRWKNKRTNATGSFTTDPAAISAKVGLLRPKSGALGTFHVELPPGAWTAGDKVEVSMTLSVAAGPYCGDGSHAPQILIQYSTDARVVSGTIIHEAGHLMNMVPMEGWFKAPPGLSVGAHPHRYDEHGGSGSHCSWKATPGTDANGKPTWENGHCVMFHADAPTVPADFCDTCATFVKAQSLLAFSDLKAH